MTPGGAVSQLREADGYYWLGCFVVGGIRFNLASDKISAFPAQGVSEDVFERTLAHEWLPLVYQAWGYQVLHASAAACRAGGQVVAFSGDTGAGKSTLGFGLGQRPGWVQIADESLAMLIRNGRVELAPIPNFTRLRPHSARYFQRGSRDFDWLEWPSGELTLKGIYFLEVTPTEAGTSTPPVKVIQLNGAEAYPMILQQAFALSLTRHDHNQRLMSDYLQVARQVPCYRLLFSKTFPAIDEVLDVIIELAGADSQNTL